MARTNVYEINEHGERTLAGWFDPMKCESFTEGHRWDGNNNIGVISGADVRFVDETLYRTPGGRWVRNSDRSRYHNGADVYQFLTDDEARDWLLRSEDNDEAIERFFGDQGDEAGPAPIGRPSMGDAPVVTVKIPADLLARIDAAADDAGVARAEWIRRACAAALG